ncbi:MAG: hypothetical protein J7500_11005 [Sphingomonas sp.]|uniref:hypothetical protein n=1 Tax=Sphingomonas sp. TaxID=28214 RepID=UPI001B07E4FC|nr:hypothetical protein [Sphingomonas sp.]MBO9623228.1 hypothetical protein [Sphingomonas sp.]
MTDTENVLLRHRYSAQIVLALLLSALCTYGTIVLSVPPSLWNLLWMVALPALLGLALNGGVRQLVMALALPFASLIATTIVGDAMGGM